jgi:hypothetical protein
MPAPRREGGRARTGATAALLCSLCLVFSLLAGCQGPQAPAGGAPDYRGHYDPTQGALVFRVESASGGTTALQLVATQLAFDAQHHQLHAHVAIRNAGKQDVPGPDEVAVFGFLPSDVAPVNADCITAGPKPMTECLYDYRDAYGPGGTLTAGETSRAVEWILLDPSGESFAFHARLAEPRATGGGISGVVFEDRDRDGQRDKDEPGIPKVEVSLSHDETVSLMTSDSQGSYTFHVDDPGLYELLLSERDGWTTTAARSLQVVILRHADGTLSSFERGDFGSARSDSTPSPDESKSYSIKGTVFRDDNGNGRLDWGEPGLVGVGVSASGALCPDSLPAVDRTDEVGRYKLKGREVHCPLPWNLRREALPGTHDTTPAFVRLDSAPADSSDTFRVDFGVAPDSVPGLGRAYVIEGHVFLDPNRNGVRDPGEPGIAGAEVQLLSVCRELRLTHTDSTGSYRFASDVVAACHVTAVWQSLPDFDKHTTPNPVPVVPSAIPILNVLTVDFGIRPRN